MFVVSFLRLLEVFMIESKTLRVHEKSGVVYLTFPKLDAAAGQRHAFSTRIGGVSAGHCASMNFGFSVGDEPDAVRQNFRIFCNAAGLNADRLVLSKQTHTANVRCVTEEDVGKGVWKPLDYTDVDGLITNLPDTVLVTQYADCTPLLFFDPVTKTAATSHAGWRGTVAEIGARTVEKMQAVYGCDPKNIIAAIGPSIGRCCYEVDDPVMSAVGRLSLPDPDACYTDKGNGKYMLDLKEVNRQILVRAGIDRDNIDVADLCTCCNHDTLHSHRATGGKRGTLAAMICTLQDETIQV